MIEFDEIEGIEQARQAEADEERRRIEEAAYLAKVLELEAIVEARLQSQEREPQDGRQGILISIPVKDFEFLKKWKDTTSIFFSDAINASIIKLHKLLADKDRCQELGLEYEEGFVDAIAAFINSAVQLRFHDPAVSCCEQLAEAFQGERGLCALVHQLMDKSTSERRRGEARKCFTPCVRRIARLLLRLLQFAYFDTAEQREWFSERWRELYFALLPDLLQPVCVTASVEHGWQIPSEQMVELLVRVEELDEERVLHVGAKWTAEEIQHSLVVFFQCELHLFHAQDSSGEWELVQPESTVEAMRQPVVLYGLDPQHPGWRLPDLQSWPPEWVVRWRHFVNRICKTTPLTATRLLCELRSSFTSRQFQEQYRALKKDSRPGNKAHQEILSLTFNVQSAVLPRYGFEATPKGLMEMRDEMPIFAGLDVWNYNPWGLEEGGDEVVWKVRRDIHSVLDMGQVLPRMQLSGHESMGHKGWLRWAQLNASVESGCEKAAEYIAKADVFVLCVGAGFSADSGLAVYADVAKVHAYAKRGLDYSDICSQHWLRKEPEFFWGFWGQCYNDYRDTGPHEGYRIVHRWVKSRFRSSPMAKAIRRRLEEAANSEGSRAMASNMPPVERQPYVVKDHPGAFMAFTSNVDAHLWDWFHACEIRECHGNIETFQCASQEGRCDGHWRAPYDFRFHVSKSTMLAPLGRPGEAYSESESVEDSPGDPTPHVGSVRGGGRPNALWHMPDPPALASAGFRTNHPKCPFCAGPARPSILMFKDSDFRDNRSQAVRWDAWVAASQDAVRTAAGAPDAPAPRVVVVEIGAGGNVTTVRKTSEKLVHSFMDAGADPRLVRVNPELPLGDGERLGPGGDLEHLVVSIMGCGLESIRKMDAAMPSDMLEGAH